MEDESDINFYQFNNNVVILGDAPSTSTTSGALRVAGGAGIEGAAHVGEDLTVSGNIHVAGLVDGVDVSSLKIDVDGFPDELKNLTTHEIFQLQNIDNNSITSTQWGYLSKMNQDVDTTANVIFDEITGTLQTNAQPNITSVGKLVSLEVDNLHIDGNTISSTDTDGNINLIPDGNGEVILKKDPVHPLAAATKQYVDASALGLTVKDSVRVKTTSVLPAYSKSGSSVGATLTADSNGALVTGGISVFQVGDRLLLDSEGTISATDNGIWVVTQVGSVTEPWILTRADDADDSDNVKPGMFVFVNEGTCADCGYVLTTDGIIIVDTTAQHFTQFSSAGIAEGGLGIIRDGNSFNIVLDGVSNSTSGLKLTVDGLAVSDFLAGIGLTLANGVININSSQPTITSVGNLDNLEVNGVVQFYNTNDSTGPESGAVVVDGGVGIVKNLNVGGDVEIDGTLTLNGIEWSENFYINNNTITTIFDDFYGTNLLPIWSISKTPQSNSQIAMIDGLGGQVRIRSGDTTDDFSQLYFQNKTFTIGANTNLKIRCKLNSVTNTKVHIGFTDNDDTGDNLMDFQFDTSVSNNWYTRDKKTSKNIVLNDTFVLGSVNWIVLEIITSSGQVVFKLNGTTVGTHTDNLPTDSTLMRLYIRQASITDASRDMHIDYLTVRCNR